MSRALRASQGARAPRGTNAPLATGTRVTHRAAASPGMRATKPDTRVSRRSMDRVCV